MMQIDNNNYNLTDAEFFALHPQPSLLSCVYYQVEPRPAPDVAKKMMQQLTNVNPNALTPQEIDDAIASLKDGESWALSATEMPGGAPDLSEYVLSEEEMQSASDRLNQINKDVVQQKELHALLEEYFQSDRSIYDTELEVYFPIMGDEDDCKIPLTYEGLMQWHQKDEKEKHIVDSISILY